MNRSIVPTGLSAGTSTASDLRIVVFGDASRAFERAWRPLLANNDFHALKDDQTQRTLNQILPSVMGQTGVHSLCATFRREVYYSTNPTNQILRDLGGDLNVVELDRKKIDDLLVSFRQLMIEGKREGDRQRVIRRRIRRANYK